MYKKGVTIQNGFYIVEVSRAPKHIYIAAYDLQDISNKFIKSMSIQSGVKMLKRYQFNFELLIKNVRLDFQQLKLYLAEEKIPLVQYLQA